MLMTSISIVLYATAGFCLFLFLLNRSLIWMPDGTNKFVTMVAAFAVTVGGGTLVGWVTQGAWRLYVPCGVLGLFVVGEARRLIIRHLHRASAPSESVPPLPLARPVTTTDLVRYHYHISVPGWSGRALRIAHLSDLHVNGGLPHSFYERAVNLVLETDPDLIFVTGDFVTGLECLDKLSRLLPMMAGPSTYAVLGNHDYWADADRIGGMVRDSGIRLLTDESLVLDWDGAPVRITGYHYPWGARIYQPAVADPGELHLVLSHTPDNIYRLRDIGAHCIFSGHYHAGQFRLPLLGPVIVPSRYGRRYDHGHFEVEHTHLFVSAGIGSANPALRVYCRPDVFVIDIAGS